MTQLRPMLASHAPEDLDQLRYPLLASAKLDGIRCLIVNGVAVSRSLKPIRNRHIQTLLGDSRFNGLDGELIVGSPTAPDCYRRTDSAVMSADGEPPVTFYIFDDIRYPGRAFSERRPTTTDESFIIPHEHWFVQNPAELEALEANVLSLGYEGLILRDPQAPYKYGRSTEKQQFMLKLKRFTDAEAVVVGWEEKMTNLNEATLDERGYTKRSSHQEGKVPSGTLGALKCVLLQHWDQDLNYISDSAPRFSIGTGFDGATRALLWSQRDSLGGRIVRFKSFPIGIKDRPRHPVFLGFRSPEDM